MGDLAHLSVARLLLLLLVAWLLLLGPLAWFIGKCLTVGHEEA